MSRPDPEGLPTSGGTGAALAGLAEGFVRDWATNGVILLSLIVVGAGVMGGELPWMVVGPAMGVAGSVVGLLSVAKRWPLGRTWVALLMVLSLDLLLLVVMFV